MAEKLTENGRVASPGRVSIHLNKDIAGLPRSGKNIWKIIFFPGQGKVGEYCGWPGKFRKDLESQGKVRKFENKWLWQAVFRNLFILFKKEKDVLSHEIV